MRRLAELVLRHRGLVVLAWVADRRRRWRGHRHREQPDDRQLLAAGTAGRHGSQQDRRRVPQRRQHDAAARHRHHAAGSDDHRARGPGRPGLRLGEPERRPPAGGRRGEHRRPGVPHLGRPYGVRDGLLPVPAEPERRAADQAGAGCRARGRAPGRRRRRHGHGRARDRRQLRRQRRAHRDAARRAGRPGGPAVRVRLAARVPPAGRRRGLDPDHLPAAAPAHLPDRRLLHRDLPDQPGRAGSRDRLLAAVRHPMARGTRPRQGEPRGGRRGDGDRRPCRALQRPDRGDRPARPGRAARCRSCAASAWPER